MIDGFTIVILVLSALFIAYVIAERFYYKKERKKLKLVIHVNGIRGKSTVTRLIDAGLRGCGYKVYSKTTGTLPTVIGVDNTPKQIKRRGPANIREQQSVLSWAAKENAEALVVECMAVNPELQFLSENRILHADINVITNVREDHLDEMGNDLESIAYSLANTTPQNGVIILGEDKFLHCFEECADKRNTKVIVANPYTDKDSLGTFPENIAIALEVCDVLKLDRNAFFNGMKNYVHDIGALSVIELEKTRFINGFSINDPDSTLKVYQKVTEIYNPEDLTVLLNARPDRPFRISQHIEMLKAMKFKKLLVIGSNSYYIINELKKVGIEAIKIKGVNEILCEETVFACGNIANDGIKILNYFKQNGKESNLF